LYWFFIGYWILKKGLDFYPGPFLFPANTVWSSHLFMAFYFFFPEDFLPAATNKSSDSRQAGAGCFTIHSVVSSNHEPQDCQRIMNE
jgi:hypothetical protein